MSNLERDEVPEDVSPLIELTNIMGFRIAGGGVVLTDDLLQDAKDLYFVHPRFNDLTANDQEALGDESILRLLLLRQMPLSIYGEPDNPVVFNVEIAKFRRPPGSYGGYSFRKESIAYGVRFMPESGVVTDVGYRRCPDLSMYGLEALSVSPERTAMSLHGKLYVEIYKEHQVGELPPLIPPDEF